MNINIFSGARRIAIIIAACGVIFSIFVTITDWPRIQPSYDVYLQRGEKKDLSGYSDMQPDLSGYSDEELEKIANGGKEDQDLSGYSDAALAPKDDFSQADLLAEAKRRGLIKDENEFSQAELEAEAKRRGLVIAQPKEKSANDHGMPPELSGYSDAELERIVAQGQPNKEGIEIVPLIAQGKPKKESANNQRGNKVNGEIINVRFIKTNGASCYHGPAIETKVNAEILGKHVEVALCIRGAKLDEREISSLINIVVDKFSMSESDKNAYKKEYNDKIFITVGKNFSVLSVGLFALYLFCLTTGWVIRGFLGIPMGKDSV